MSQKLKFSDDLSLPVDAVTQTFAFLARRGAGKTYGACKLAELMLDAGAQVVAIDPVGVWYGLRIAADGKSPGIKIPVLGGQHGDIQLEPGAGALVADLIVDRDISAVLDVSMMRKGDRQRFATAFAEQLFHRKKSARSPVHVFIEEAQAFVPQRVMGEDARMLGAFEDIVKLGRNFGIGATLISQRPQAIHKDCLNQTECVIAMQTNGSQERKALEAWIVDQGLDVRSLVQDLPSLPRGTAWVWSPSWLGITKKVRIGARRTFNASATPEVGQRAAAARELAPIDLDKIRTAMADVVKRAEEDDPKALRRRIKELERSVAERAAIAPKIERVEVPVLTAAHVESLKAMASDVEGAMQKFDEGLRNLSALISKATRAPAPAVVRGATYPHACRVPNIGKVSTPRAVRTSEASSVLTGPERKLMTALAQYPKGRTKTQLAILTAYAHSGGAFNNYLSSLRSKGMIADAGGLIAATDEGLAALGDFEPLPSGRELVAHWMTRLGKAERAALTTLLEVFPKSLSKEELGHRAGYEPNGGGFNNALSKLRTLELISGRGELRASEELV